MERARGEFAEGGTIPAVATREAFNGPTPFAVGSGDLLVVFVQPEQEEEVETYLARTVSRKSLILVVDEGPETRPRAGLTENGITRLAFSDTPGGWDRLFALCAEAAGDRGTAPTRTRTGPRRACR